MNSKSAGIYLIISKINGKRYVGSAVRICKRWIQHLCELRANRHHSQHLQNHFNKYGEDDLVFSILEVVERGELTLNDFKELLLSREQAYLDNWDECQFNSRPIAGSNLGHKFKGAKYYVYLKKFALYKTTYNVLGKRIEFTHHNTEEEAIKEVEYLKTLTDIELLEYKQKCLDRPKTYTRREDTKNYTWNTQSSKWVVKFRINGKYKQFGSYKTEQEAIDRVKQLKLELGFIYK